MSHFELVISTVKLELLVALLLVVVHGFELAAVPLQLAETGDSAHGTNRLT
jgi:hypothetical protein